MSRNSEDEELLVYSEVKREEEDADDTEHELPFPPQPRRRLLKNLQPIHVGISAGFFLILLSFWYNASSSSNPQYCRWTFESYTPSSYEVDWSKNARQWQGDICSKLVETKHETASKYLVKRALELYQIPATITWPTRDSQPRVDYDSQDDVFSRMNYRQECYEEGGWVKTNGKGVQLIEPLWGMLRDPFDLFCEGKRLHMAGWPDAGGQSKAHIIPQGYAPYTYSTTGEDLNSIKWHTHGSPPWIDSYSPSPSKEFGTLWTAPKNVLLDLGSSYFGSWGTATNAASGAWMYRTYHQRGLPFHKYVAVEVESLSPAEAYKQLPADLVGVYSFMNTPLNMDKGDKLNTVELLRSIAKVNDHVVLKLDIDSANMELPFAQALRTDPSLGLLVSELFFEHHVDIEPMRKHWGGGLKEDLKDSYDMFHDLRSNGIRAHSWP